MRGKIKLDQRKHLLNDEGFPVIFYVTKDSKDKIIRTGYRSKKEHWDKANALPLKKHPKYLELLNYLIKKKPVLAKLLEESRYRSVPIHEVENKLLGFDSDIFYTMGLTVKGSRTYKIALESFNRYYPNYSFSAITPKIAKNYMEVLMATDVRGKQRSPNGVISYMNTLTAIWNKLEKPNNPFSGIRPKAKKTKNKALTDEDLIKIINNDYELHANSKGGGIKNYLNYFMLCFYLGGIDLGDLVLLKHTDIINNRIEFTRSKGGTNVSVSNYVFPEAWEIINGYGKKGYLIPLGKTKYRNFIPNLSRYLPDVKERLGLSKLPYSKAARYSFVTRAQNLLIDERICIKIVGHSQSSTHSVYKDEFPHHIQDEAHRRIVDLEH